MAGFIFGGRVEEFLYYLNFLIEVHRDLMIILSEPSSTEK